MTSGVRELHFRLNAGRPDNSEYTTGLDRVVEQGRLSDAYLAMHDQHAAASAIEQSVEHLALAFAPEQLPSRRSHQRFDAHVATIIVEEEDPGTIEDETNAEVLLLDQGTQGPRARAELGWEPTHAGLVEEFRTGS